MPNPRVLEIRLLGGFTAALGHDPVPPMPSRHARLLLAYLALHPDRAHPRPTLIDRLWPELDEPRARKRLSHTLWQVQDVLAEASPGRTYVEATLDTVRFGDAPARVDVHEFDQGLDEVERGDALDGDALARLRTCVDLYRGDLLAGYYEPWILEEQARLSQRYVDALTRLVTSAKRRSNFDEALTYARRLTHQAPLREDIHREVMRLSVLLGRHSEALQQYERCRTVLADEMGVEPEASTRELALRIAATRHDRPPEPRPDRLFASRRLVGRRAERHRILDRMDRALSGRGETVLVEGEPGIGKTRLLAQVSDDARWRGFTVLWGTCEAEGGRPYQPLRDAIAPYLTPVRIAQLRHTLGDECLADLGHLFPEAVDTRRQRVVLGAADSAERMRESIVRLLLALTESSPTTLVIDDLHWSDAETLEVLRALARRHDTAPLLVVLGYRAQEGRDSEAVWGTLRSLDRFRAPERVELRALSAFETSELIGEAVEESHVPARLASAIQRESGGNPLYVVELLRNLRDRGDLDTAAELADLTVPRTSDLHALIEERVGRVGEPAGRVLRLAAVLGTEFGSDVLTAASPLPPDDTAIAVDELLRRNLLESRGRRAAFTHAAARQVVLHGTSESERRDLHLRAADALEADGADRPEAIARHLVAAGHPARAFPHLRRAATDAVALSAYRSADTFLTEAVALLDRVPLWVEERYDLLAEHEVVLGVLGARDRQAEVLASMDELADDDRRRAEVLRRTALLRGLVDSYDDAETLAREAVDLGATLDRHEHGSGLVVLGRILSWSGRNNEATAVLAEGADALTDRPSDEAEARFALGTAYTDVQDAAGALDALTRARELFELAGDRRGVAQVAGALGTVHALVGRLDDARREHEAAIEEASEIGFLFRASISRMNLGNLLVDLRDPAGALRAYEDSLTGFRALDNQRGAAFARANQGWVLHRWIGDDTQAEALLDDCIAFMIGVGNLPSAAHPTETLAAVARRRGEHEHARLLLDRALAWARDGEDRVGEAQALRGLAELDLAVGDPERARMQACAGRDVARDADIVAMVPELSGIEALTCLALDDLPAAQAAIEHALEHLPDTNEPHLLHHRAAQVARAHRDETGAAEHDRQAAAILEEALSGLSEAQRRQSLRAIPDHAAIAAAGTVHAAEREVRLARVDAPRGRALGAADLTVVRLRLPVSGDTPGSRRQTLLSVVEQAAAQGAAATIDDLVDIVGVSRATVRRDLRALRDQGHAVTTRGSSGR